MKKKWKMVMYGILILFIFITFGCTKTYFEKQMKIVKKMEYVKDGDFWVSSYVDRRMLVELENGFKEEWRASCFGPCIEEEIWNNVEVDDIIVVRYQKTIWEKKIIEWRKI